MARVPITPAVLNWAIDESGYEPEEVAAAVGVEVSTIEAWLDDRDQPSNGAH